MAYSSKYTLPSYLDARILGRAQAALNHLKVDGTRVRYVGPGDDDSQAATIRTNAPAPPDCPLYYFEVEIVSSGHKGYIGIGFQTEDVLLSRLPGWDPHSYGYHGDDGNAFQGSGAGRSFGPTYGTGDTMGALLNRAERTISFFKNGQSLGVAFRSVTEDRLFPCVGLRTKDEEVRLNLGGAKHSAAGAKGTASKAPFVADFHAMQDSFRAKVLSDINATPLPLQSSSATPLLPQLLYNHLMHHRYWRTAGAIQQDLLQPSASSHGEPTSCQGPVAAALQQTDADMAEGVPTHTEGSQGRAGQQQQQQQKQQQKQHPSSSTKQAAFRRGQESRVDKAGEDGMFPSTSGPLPGTVQWLLDLGVPHDIAARQATYELVQSGQVDEACATLDACYGPELLQGQPSLDFRLHIARFCQILKDGGPHAMEKALAYGRDHLTPQRGSSGGCSGKLSADEQELLGDALSLLAYDNPESAPAGHLLGQAQRDALAEAVNCAILAHRGAPPTSSLERLSRQTLAAIQALRERNHPQALMLDAQAMVFGS